ncbi:hypothetical protein DL1_16385 [Thioclava dalianensis]|uniref:Uncharacterized protein n=1 Tax=Thioclava dalianensis TaxID=1185766 RepID=A0A074TG41_9RHOB|nr:DUF6525 family protein [Thioclava dalianensis]KEP70676.1 hypothetical protein DL1_16385 [Thioclava dalianensis]SFN05192.1 hypothetical protein SAMN05216224_102154 [Thioclava dalianensis]
MRRNLDCSLRRTCRRSDPMAEFDRLPAPARAWAQRAVLPWSARSIRRIWARALSETRSEEAALARLARAEARTLAREAAPNRIGEVRSV